MAHKVKGLLCMHDDRIFFLIGNNIGQSFTHKSQKEVALLARNQ